MTLRITRGMTVGEDEGEDFTLEAGSIIVAGVVPRLHQVVGAIEEAISEAEVVDAVYSKIDTRLQILSTLPPNEAVLYSSYHQNDDNDIGVLLCNCDYRFSLCDLSHCLRS